jgi:hypothetical protein
VLEGKNSTGAFDIENLSRDIESYLTVGGFTRVMINMRNMTRYASSVKSANPSVDDIDELIALGKIDVSPVVAQAAFALEAILNVLKSNFRELNVALSDTRDYDRLFQNLDYNFMLVAMDLNPDRRTLALANVNDPVRYDSTVRPWGFNVSNGLEYTIQPPAAADRAQVLAVNKMILQSALAGVYDIINVPANTPSFDIYIQVLGDLARMANVQIGLVGDLKNALIERPVFTTTTVANSIVSRIYRVVVLSDIIPQSIQFSGGAAMLLDTQVQIQVLSWRPTGSNNPLSLVYADRNTLIDFVSSDLFIDGPLVNLRDFTYLVLDLLRARESRMRMTGRLGQTILSALVESFESSLPNAGDVTGSMDGFFAESIFNIEFWFTRHVGISDDTFRRLYRMWYVFVIDFVNAAGTDPDLLKILTDGNSI